MKPIEFHPVRFINKDRTDFAQVLRKRVDEYFKTNNISQQGNGYMVLKTVIMLSLYIVPFAIILFAQLPVWATFPLWIIMGFGVAGIGLSVMHDANHGAYSKSKLVNRLVSYTLDFLGASSFNWRLQHNMLHHTYTNIVGMDEDLQAGRILRFTPHDEWQSHHRFQHIYGLPLYSLETMMWLVYSDFPRLKRYIGKGLLKQLNANPTERYVKLVVQKLLYLVYMFGLPLMLTSYGFGYIFLGWFFMQMVAGFTLSLIFQMAHVIEETDMPLPDTNHIIENEWFIHQLHTTADFATNNRVLNWYAGGLNFQVEHHLFPNVCHLHYKAISKIVSATAKEYGIPYIDQPTFLSAVKSHVRLLKRLGQKPSTSAA